MTIPDDERADAVSSRARRNGILFVLQSFILGGAERSVYALAGRLSQLVHVDIATIQRCGEINAKDFLECPPKRLNLWGRFGVFFRLPWIVWTRRPTIVMGTLWDINLLILMLRWLFPKSVRVVVREAAMLHAALQETPAPQVWRCLCRHYYSRADRVVVMTNAMKAALIRDLTLSPERICVIPNAVDVLRLPDISATGKVVKDPPLVRLIAIGRLVPQKGFDVLIRALSEAVKQHPGTLLTICGDGPDRRYLTELVQSLGLSTSVIFAGYVQNPYPLLLESDVFVLSSRYEGMSNALLEALCCGVPALAVVENNGADEVVVDGENGFLVPRCEVRELADGITRAMRGYRKLDRHRIASLARSSLSIEHQVSRYQRLFRELDVG